MKLNDLKTGYMVELRNGDRMMVLRDFYDSHGSIKNVFFDIIKNEWDNFEAYNEDMKCIYDSLCDVMKVIAIPSPVEHNFKYGKRIVIWERKEIDWSKVEKDTAIYVRDNENMDWEPRHFAKYEYGKIYAYKGGFTSHTTDDIMDWKFAKLKEYK